MTVGELIVRLAKYHEDTEVLVQSPDARFVWPMHPCLGEDEDIDHIYVMATDPPRVAWVADPSLPISDGSQEKP